MNTNRRCEQHAARLSGRRGPIGSPTVVWSKGRPGSLSPRLDPVRNLRQGSPGLGDVLPPSRPPPCPFARVTPAAPVSLCYASSRLRIRLGGSLQSPTGNKARAPRALGDTTPTTRPPPSLCAASRFCPRSSVAYYSTRSIISIAPSSGCLIDEQPDVGTL